MKVVILAGGQQSTINNTAEGIPKPMVEIGGKPLLWHIMKHFSQYGLKEFIVCAGYRIDMIKQYFMDFYIYESDITVDLQNNTLQVHKKKTEDWKVTVVDTGVGTTPGQRVKAVESYLDSDLSENFILTYGDCLSDIDITKMMKDHTSNTKLVTMAIAKPQGRKRLVAVSGEGLLETQVNADLNSKDAWVSADCYILDKKALNCLDGKCDFDEQIINNLSKIGQIKTYKHDSFWTTVETMRDLVEAEHLWEDGKAPWLM